jgi:hypothetical protein
VSAARVDERTGLMAPTGRGRALERPRQTAAGALNMQYAQHMMAVVVMLASGRMWINVTTATLNTNIRLTCHQRPQKT